jgi:hypothetical protein
MRARFALFVAGMSLVACGGSVADDANGSADPRRPVGAVADPLMTLRMRCAPEWKNPVGGAGPAPATTLIAGRWLRCAQESAGLQGSPHVATFEGIELGADGTFFRLAVGAGGFERRTNDLGDTGKWMLSTETLLFELPRCDQGKITDGNVTKCGGFDAVQPMFETSPTRMRFYGDASFYVKEE